ncbi:MAG: RnfABCDGE type electron transport complex subunit D [Lachnospiraceae bacterium]|nr:RnfABCDGE type electron transport complex subunit D [Lachnospiraceae bacterium]
MEVTNLNLVVSPVPHMKSHVTTRKLMLNVIIALMPALIAAVVIFGARVILITAVSVISCVLFEFIWGRLRKRQVFTIIDLSAVVTGLLLAFNLPVTVPVYLPVIGSLFAIIVTKELFGGLGCNFANPAIVGRIVLAVSFPSLMTAYTYPAPYAACDALSSATPLGTDAPIPVIDLLLGTHGGVIGETCCIALLIGLVWLLATKTIEITIPLVYIGVVALMSLAFGHDVLKEILSGGLLLGAIFMATDYVTSPFTRKGKIIFAVGLGLITCVIRFWGNMNEGVSYSILLMNLLVPAIDAATRRKPMGGAVKK